MQLVCPNCCLDSIQFSSDNGSCFYACAYLDSPTAASWKLTDTRRAGVCNNSSLTMTPDINNYGSTSMCNGNKLMLKFCGTTGSSYTYKAYKHWDGTIITGTIQS